MARRPESVDDAHAAILNIVMSTRKKLLIDKGVTFPVINQVLKSSTIFILDSTIILLSTLNLFVVLNFCHET